MLWLALYITNLALTAAAVSVDSDQACAVADHQRILACNAPARRLGVRPGMSRPSAQALVPDLRLSQRDVAREEQKLLDLAELCLGYTSRVSPEPPDGLLLEVGGSLRLFGGLDSLCQSLSSRIERAGFQAGSGVAPTPRGAWLLARAGDSSPVIDPGNLRQRLSGLPTTVLTLTDTQQQHLRDLGLTTLGECLAVPGGELDARLGPGCLQQLRQAIGLQAEPRTGIQPRRRPVSRLEVNEGISGSGRLIGMLPTLIGPLCRDLQSLDAWTEALQLRLQHEDQTRTELSIGLLTGSRDPDTLIRVTGTRLETVQLTAPVHAIELEALPTWRPRTDQSDDLFQWLDTRFDPAASRSLLERLRARLGESGVHRLSTRSEHRPEHAWQPADLQGALEQTAHPGRPLWLLAGPRRLRSAGNGPCWNGPLRLCSGPERLEGGWWEHNDSQRDYYIAQDARGQTLWVFRNRQPPHDWFLHGFFA